MNSPTRYNLIYSGSVLPEVYYHMGLEAVSHDLQKVPKYPKYF